MIRNTTTTDNDNISILTASFCDGSGKPINVPDSEYFLADITYFTFRTIVYAFAVDSRAPATNYLLNFHYDYPSP